MQNSSVPDYIERHSGNDPWQSRLRGKTTMTNKSGPDSTKPCEGCLTPVDAANAIRSARLNARELLDSAELMFTLKRFPHCTALSILAIEEAAKVGVLLMIFLEIGGDRARLWKSYRNHRAKTSWLNPAIESRVPASFPPISREAAKQIGTAGPTPDQLETSKQRALYSDCLEVSGDLVAHCPNLAEWRKDAWERMCEAQAVLSALRDYPPDELRIWREHIAQAVSGGKELSSALSGLDKDLLESNRQRKHTVDKLLNVQVVVRNLFELRLPSLSGLSPHPCVPPPCHLR
jgi:AbiV family abortive infection protein